MSLRSDSQPSHAPASRGGAGHDDRGALERSLSHLAQTLDAELEFIPLLRRVTEEVTAAMAADAGALLCPTDGAQSFAALSVAGASRASLEALTIPRDDALIAAALRGDGAARVDDAIAHRDAADPSPLARLEAPLRSYLAVPVVLAGGEVFGALLFGQRAEAAFGEREQRAAAAIARQVAASVGSARLYHDARLARQSAELVARRISRLQAVTAALSEALTPAQVAEVIVEHAVGAVGAAHGRVYLLSGDALELLRERGKSRPLQELSVPIDAAHPAAEALRTQQPVWIERRDARASADPTTTVAGRSSCFVPLATKGREIGVISMGFFDVHVFPEDERAFILTLARQCAQALDRARLYEVTRASNERLRLLAEAGSKLSSSLDHETTLNNVARLCMPTLGDFGFFDVVEQDGSVRRIGWADADPTVQALLAGTRWKWSERTDINVCALASARPGYHPNVDDAWMEAMAAGPEDLALMRRLAFRSMITVPLVIRHETLGALTLFFGSSGRRHTDADLELAEELARRSATAVENARLYAAAQASKREAEAASRMKDEFLSVVSHELRTPLTAILGWARVLQGKSQPADPNRALQVIERNAKAQGKLIDDILDVSRIVNGKLRLELRPIDLRDVVTAALDVLRPTAEAKTIALGSVTGAPVIALGDADRLQQVVWNLVSNALKFTPAGGCVTVTVARRGDSGVIEVADDGAGISDEFLPHVFDRFRQADSSSTRAHGGLGLGLAIVRHLVELHGGTVHAASEGPGHGATFTLVLPGCSAPVAAVPGAADTLAAIAASGVPVRLDGVRVLVVDDEPDAREVIAALLTEHGAVVEVAGSAEEALAAMAVRVPQVLLSDIGMPGQDGYALLRRVRSLEGSVARVPVLALTAYARAEDGRRMLEAGFQMHLPKPADAAALTAAVARLSGRIGL